MAELDGVPFGFVGTGVITEAVVTGLSKTRLSRNPVFLSPRSETISRKLADTYANVRVGRSNQHVVDNADIVFLAVRPQIAEEVVRDLSFRAGQRVVSFIAATSLEILSRWIEQDVRLTQCIPLPFVADLNGATTIHPSDDMVEEIFSELGTPAVVGSKREYDLLAVASTLMGTYFGILDAASVWLESQGLSQPAAHAYLRQLFSGLANAARSKPDVSFATLTDEHCTPGGLNEQVLNDFRRDGGLQSLSKALDGVAERIFSGHRN